MSLISEQSLLVLSAQKIQNLSKGNMLLTSLFLELTIASNLAEAYNKTHASIYWKEASPKTRQRVNETLNDLTWKIADHLEESVLLFNQICDQNQISNNLDSDLYHTLAFISYRIECVFKTVKRFLKPRQLKLL